MTTCAAAVSGTPQQVRFSRDMTEKTNFDAVVQSPEEDTFAEDALDVLGRTAALEQDLRRPRLVSESEDYTNVSYDLYALSVR